MQFANDIINSRSVFWIFIVSTFLAFFFLFSDISFPFLFGFSLAYCFIPCVDFLSKYINRAFVSAIITIMIITIFVIAVIGLIPKLKECILLISSNIQEYGTDFLSLLSDPLSFFNIGQEDVASFENEIHRYFEKKIHILASIVGEIASKRDRISSFFSFFIVMPISFFYFLRDWNLMTSIVHKCLPFRDRVIYKEITGIVRKTLSNFFQGQFCVVAALSIYYSFFLGIIGIESYEILGIVSGLFSFIPLIGAMFSFVLVVLISVPILTIPMIYGLLFIYFVGPFIEGYVLYPKFVGKKTGLHPLWIIFSFFAGIKLQGIIGVLISIPSAAIIRSLIGFSIDKFVLTQSYKK